MAAKKSSPVKPSSKKNQTQVSPLEGSSIPLRLPPNLMASLRKIIKEAREEYYGHGIPDLEVVSCILREGKPEMNPENLLAHFKRKYAYAREHRLDAPCWAFGEMWDCIRDWIADSASVLADRERKAKLNYWGIEASKCGTVTP